MKKFIAYLAFGAVIAVGLTSCETTCVICHDCSQGNNLDGTEFCQDDFSNVNDYDTAVSLAEGQGCTCD